MTATQADRGPNRLASEKSPYLLQHAHNPVDWFPWGEEAFEEARRSGRPIFLSIGYSTCHWCHVMERESFEDPETAAIMNDLFVSIKVDREERPDIDEVYMTAAQAVTGSGGWPLSVWLTHDLRPFYVGTYFPPRPAHGRPSFREVLRSLREAWDNQREKVDRSAEAITHALTQGAIVADVPSSDEQELEVIDACYRQIMQSYDAVHGGFGPAPKFPRPSIFEFLFRYHVERQSDMALAMAHQTLRQTSAGGIYDQLGGGFARYSVDAQWRVPHFEKMLYDQGQLLAALADAWRLTGDDEIARVIRQTVGYLERDMLSPEGGFYSAEDADSEGEEGAFYVWTDTELGELLDARELDAVRRRYGITPEGNFEHGRNVLHTSATLEEIASAMDTDAGSIATILESAHRTLLEARGGRERPSLDDKVLTSWNGLLITGLARAGAALGAPEYIRLASRAADLLLERLVVDGRLMHRYRDGEVKYVGYLDDYAFLAQGLVDLYEAGFEIKYLREAERLTRDAVRLFWDPDGGGFFMTSGEDSTVLIRSKSDHDGAEPSGNSVMAHVLLRLGRLFYDTELIDLADRTIRMFTARVAGYPMAMPLMVAADLARQHPPRQIIIAGTDDADATRRLIGQAHETYRPDTTLVFLAAGARDRWLLEKIPTAVAMAPLDGAPAAYVCENFTCQAPVLTLA